MKNYDVTMKSAPRPTCLYSSLFLHLLDKINKCIFFILAGVEIKVNLCGGKNLEIFLLIHAADVQSPAKSLRTVLELFRTFHEMFWYNCS
jgi:hypothetical protein